MNDKPKLEVCYDLENVICEKHPKKEWPHRTLFGWCAGPGIPKKKCNHNHGIKP